MNTNLSALILNKFSDGFFAAYNKLGDDKTKILKYTPILFKRWYYSALLSETTLSPSFIHNTGTGGGKAYSALSITARMADHKFKDFIIKENFYSPNAHPVVRDLSSLVNFCAPDIELDENDFINAKSSVKVSQCLSLSDPFYVEYLTSIAFQLRLLKKSVAIYSNKATISNNYIAFLELNQEEALKKIVNATVKLCVRNINTALPQSLSFLSEKGILRLIKKPIPIDDIFKKIFQSFGVDIEYVWDTYSESNVEPTVNDNVILSSTFFLGLLLDKWFITPFGEYLKIIEPIYCFSYNFIDEINYLTDVINSGGDVCTALFSPCAFYSFTPLGRLIFAADTKGLERDRHSNMPVAELLDLLNIDGTGSVADTTETKIKKTKVIYSFKVWLAEDKRYWTNIDVADYNTLHELHEEIVDNFKLASTDYCFFTSETLTPFSKYVSPKSKGKMRRADKTTIIEFSFIKGNKMIYLTDGGKKIELELIKCEHVGIISMYPHTTRRSRMIKELE